MRDLIKLGTAESHKKASPRQHKIEPTILSRCSALLVFTIVHLEFLVGMGPPQKPSQLQWQVYKPVVRNLYLTRDFSLAEVVASLQSNGFRVT